VVRTSVQWETEVPDEERPRSPFGTDYQNGKSLRAADASWLRDGRHHRSSARITSTTRWRRNRLLPVDIVCVMRERTQIPRSIIERLSPIQTISASTGGPVNAAIRTSAGSSDATGVFRGFPSGVVPVGPDHRISLGALSWTSARNMWPRATRFDPAAGKHTGGGPPRETLGVLGRGRIGSRVADRPGLSA